LAALCTSCANGPSRWVLNLDRVVPDARIVSNPLAHAIAAIKLSHGDLNGAPPKSTNPSQIWVVEPAVPDTSRRSPTRFDTRSI
jgi:hypothetical protein